MPPIRFSAGEAGERPGVDVATKLGARNKLIVRQGLKMAAVHRGGIICEAWE
jgi:hypothetical protein